MGITGTEVSKEAAVMILTDDNFATIVKAVELGRALYDNLVRYIRFQMAGLFGFIGTFLGAAILFIAQGMPFLPLQTLWVNFTVQVFLAIGLGYGKARHEGLMKDAPRSPTVPILGTRLLVYLVFIGVVISALTLAVIAWATPVFGETVARTMGLTTFAFTNIWFALETADEDASMFSAKVLGNAVLLKTAGLALVATVDHVRAGAAQPDPRHGQPHHGPVADRVRGVAGRDRRGRGEEAAQDPDDGDPALAAVPGTRHRRRLGRRLAAVRRRSGLGGPSVGATDRAQLVADRREARPGSP